VKHMKLLLPDDLHKALKSHAVDVDETMPNVVIELIKRHLVSLGKYKEESEGE
jgi:hypothetical protein